MRPIQERRRAAAQNEGKIGLTNCGFSLACKEDQVDDENHGQAMMFAVDTIHPAGL
jgi:hypothetical protein